MSNDDVCSTYQFRTKILKKKIAVKRRKVWTFHDLGLYSLQFRINTRVTQIVIIGNTIQLLFFSKFSKNFPKVKIFEKRH